MQRNKPRIPPNPQQHRNAILGQSTSGTEAADQSIKDPKNSDTTGVGANQRGDGEVVEPVNRSMYPPIAPKIPWDKIAVYVGIFIAAIPFIWYLAVQDSTVKNLVEDSKDLKKRADDTTRFTIESGLRLTSVEQRVSGVEQRERTIGHSNEVSTQIVSGNSSKTTSTR